MSLNVAKFFLCEDGAVTVDFVVLTAAICTLGLIVGTSIGRGATELANETETFMSNTVREDLGI